MHTLFKTLLLAAMLTPVLIGGDLCSGITGKDAGMCFHREGMRLADTGNLAEAESAYQNAVRVWKELGHAFDAHRATTVAQIAGLEQMTSRWDRAIDHLRESVELYHASLGDAHERTLSVTGRLAVAYSATGHMDKAMPLFDKVLAPGSAANESDRAVALNALGAYYGLRGEYDHALDLLGQAEQLMRKGGESDSAYGAVLCNLAAVYIAAEQPERAEPLLRKSRAIYTAALGPRHIRMGSLALQEGGLALAMNRNTDAERLLRQAYDIAQGALPRGSDELATYQISLGLAYLRNGKLAESDSVLTPAVDIKRAVYKDPHRELAVAVHRLAALRAAQHRNRDAARLYREAVDTYEQALGKDSRDLRLALNDYAEFAKSTRDQALAKSLRSRANSIHSYN